jgi:hypothetical protein
MGWVTNHWPEYCAFTNIVSRKKTILPISKFYPGGGGAGVRRFWMPINPSELVFVSAQVIRTIATPGAATAHFMSTVGSLEQEQPGFCGSRTVTKLSEHLSGHQRFSALEKPDFRLFGLQST